MAESFAEHVLVHYRWALVVFFLLPLSFLYDLYAYARNRWVFWRRSAPAEHASRAREVQRQVRAWIEGGKKGRMCSARPGWQTMCFRRPLYKNSMRNIRVDLVDVLEVDPRKMTVTVEPLVNMGQLSATLLPLGYTIPVVPEIDDLTVGGLVMGTGIESSSHVHGLFQHVCVSYELVLADGSLATCSKDENPDLFYAVPWSYGTLGFLTSVEIKIVPAKKFVRLRYRRADGEREIAETFEREATRPDPHLFVEGIVFGRETAVVMTGDMVDAPGTDGKINEIGRWYKPWFFSHVENAAHDQIEYIPLRQYFHRHTRALFWELRDIVPFGNSPPFRLLLGWLMPPKVSLLKITQTRAVKDLYERSHVIQDMLVPVRHLRDALKEFHDKVEVYPVWLCPFRLPRQPGMLKLESESGDNQMYVDIGVYGVPQQKRFEAKTTTRALERFVTERGGFQMLYADTYMTLEEFRRMFDHRLYDATRAKLGCDEAFPEVYEKVCRASRD